MKKIRGHTKWDTSHIPPGLINHGEFRCDKNLSRFTINAVNCTLKPIVAPTLVNLSGSHRPIMILSEDSTFSNISSCF